MSKTPKTALSAVLSGPVKGLQVNGCRTPGCVNFDVVPVVVPGYVDPNYSVRTRGGTHQLFCNGCRRTFSLMAGPAVLLEVERLRTKDGAWHPGCPRPACTNFGRSVTRFPKRYGVKGLCCTNRLTAEVPFSPDRLYVDRHPIETPDRRAKRTPLDRMRAAALPRAAPAERGDGRGARAVALPAAGFRHGKRHRVHQRDDQGVVREGGRRVHPLAALPEERPGTYRAEKTAPSCAGWWATGASRGWRRRRP